MDGEGIFLNYRQNRHVSSKPDAVMERLPHAQLVEAIADRLRRHFGTHVVFLDTEIRKGAHYPTELRAKLYGSEVLVAVIHAGWTDDLKDRLERLKKPGVEEYDWVHREISDALRKKIHVFPLLIGEAELPPRSELPTDIKGIGYAQAHWIRFGSWERDVRMLIQALEHHVAPAPMPEMKAPETPKPRSWWEFAVAFVLGVLLPVVPTWLLVDTPVERSLLLAALAFVVLLMMVFLVGALFALYRARGWLDTVDDATARIAHDQKGAAIIGSTIAGFGVAFLFTDNTFGAEIRMVLLAVIAGIAVTFGAKWVLSFRTPQEWPKQELPAVTTSVRAELNLVAKHITDHEPLLTRLERDQALFALKQIKDTNDVIAALAARTRWGWLRASVPWGWANAVLLGSVSGSAVGAVVAYRSSGGIEWWVTTLGLLACVIAVGSLWGSIEFAFRRQRWHLLVVADAVPARLAELHERLATSSIPPMRRPKPRRLRRRGGA